jgi:hypothetical protein
LLTSTCRCSPASRLPAGGKGGGPLPPPKYGLGGLSVPRSLGGPPWWSKPPRRPPNGPPRPKPGLSDPGGQPRFCRCKGWSTRVHMDTKTRRRYCWADQLHQQADAAVAVAVLLQMKQAGRQTADEADPACNGAY